MQTLIYIIKLEFLSLRRRYMYLPYKTSLGAPEVANYSISLKEVATQGDSWNSASVEQEETVVFVGLEEQDWPIRITHPDTAVCS